MDGQLIRSELASNAIGFAVWYAALGYYLFVKIYSSPPMATRFRGEAKLEAFLVGPAVQLIGIVSLLYSVFDVIRRART